MGPRKKSKEGKIVVNVLVVEKIHPPLVIDTPIGPSNHFVVLSSSASNLEEGKFQHLDGIELDSEAIIVTLNQVSPSHSNPIWDGEPPLVPIGDCSPPSYNDIAQKKSAESSDSSDENSIEQLSKKAGKKSKKEAQEE